MTWEEMAIKLAKGAERAETERDVVASLILALKAAECAKIARLLSQSKSES